jgi:hypothetical protein
MSSFRNIEADELAEVVAAVIADADLVWYDRLNGLEGKTAFVSVKHTQYRVRFNGKNLPYVDVAEGWGGHEILSNGSFTNEEYRQIARRLR